MRGKLIGALELTLANFEQNGDLDQLERSLGLISRRLREERHQRELAAKKGSA